MSSHPVFFQTCPETHRQGPGPHHHREKCLRLAVLPFLAVPPPFPVVSCSPPQSPAVPLFPNVESHGGSLFCNYFCIRSFYASVLYLLPYCFLCFGVFPCHWLFSVLIRFRLMEPETEMQLSGYHGCWGCSITKFFIAGSCAREDIRNCGASSLIEWRKKTLPGSSPQFPTVPHSLRRQFHIAGPVILTNDGRPEVSQTRTDGVSSSRPVLVPFRTLGSRPMGPTGAFENTESG